MTVSSDPILVVENGRLYTEQLMTHGHRVVVAHDDDGAIGLLRSSRPGLVLLDMTAPQLDAVELCRQSRAIIGPGIPIIVLASPDDPDALYEVLQSGADDYLLTLEAPETVLERIDYWLQNSTGPSASEVRAEAMPRETEPVFNDFADEIDRGTPEAPATDLGTTRGQMPPGGTARPRPRQGRPGRLTAGKRPQERQALTVTKWSAIIASVIWMLVSGYQQFSRIEPVHGFRSPEYQRQAEECRGTFRERYECKSAIMVANENRVFNAWMIKLSIVFVPPLVLAVLYHSVLLRLFSARRSRRSHLGATPARH